MCQTTLILTEPNQGGLSHLHFWEHQNKTTKKKKKRKSKQKTNNPQRKRKTKLQFEDQDWIHVQSYNSVANKRQTEYPPPKKSPPEKAVYRVCGWTKNQREKKSKKRTTRLLSPFVNGEGIKFQREWEPF